MNDLLAQLERTVQKCYWDLLAAQERGDAEAHIRLYADLVADFATHGLDADVAESAVDWCEGGFLAESLGRALDARRPRRSA